MVSIRYHEPMGMTLRTSEEQTEALRRQAAAEGRSMQAVALSAIDEYIARRAHKAKVDEALASSRCRGGQPAAAPQGCMIEYLDLEDLFEIARRVVGEDVAVRDHGLLESARARPRARVRQDAYADVHLKAAALLQSLARNDALVDGNSGFAWTACRTFLAINGGWIKASEDERFELVIRVDGRRPPHRRDRPTTSRLELGVGSALQMPADPRGGPMSDSTSVWPKSPMAHGHWPDTCDSRQPMRRATQHANSSEPFRWRAFG